MSLSHFAARYSPPSSVYLAEVKADVLAGVISQAARATRAHDAAEADLLLGTAEDRLAQVLDAVRAARADLKAEMVETDRVVSMDAAPASFQQAGGVGSKILTRLVPRSAPVKAAGAMGTTSPGPEAA